MESGQYRRERMLFLARRMLWVAVAGLWLVAGRAQGQEWARQMFDHTEHNFGTVARGAKVEHRFTLQNKFKEDINIISAQSSCGCTSPHITKNVLKTWETGEIVAVLDTKSFLGHKEASITVRFGGRFAGEIILRVSAMIRGDVVVQPGSVEFGTLAQGATADRTVMISYAGRPDWRIESVEHTNPALQLTLSETARQPGSISYQLNVRLKGDAPVGYVRDQLVLVTNDLNSLEARVPINVEAAVKSAISVGPSPLLLGVVAARQSISKTLVVQSSVPFRVLAVKCDDDRFKFQVPEGVKPLHLVPVTLAAGSTAGQVSSKIHIQTDAPNGADLVVAVQARIVDPGASESEPTPAGPMAPVPLPNKPPAEKSKSESKPAAEKPAESLPVLKLP